MAMDYSRLGNILKANGTTLYKLNAEKVIGSATRRKLLGQQPGGIDTRTIEGAVQTPELPARRFYDLCAGPGRRITQLQASQSPLRRTSSPAGFAV